MNAGIDAAIHEVRHWAGRWPAGAHLVHIRVVNGGSARSSAVDKSAGQTTFLQKLAGPKSALNRLHTAEVGGPRPSSPTVKAQVRSLANLWTKAG